MGPIGRFEVRGTGAPHRGELSRGGGEQDRGHRAGEGRAMGEVARREDPRTRRPPELIDLDGPRLQHPQPEVGGEGRPVSHRAGGHEHARDVEVALGAAHPHPVSVRGDSLDRSGGHPYPELLQRGTVLRGERLSHRDHRDLADDPAEQPDQMGCPGCRPEDRDRPPGVLVSVAERAAEDPDAPRLGETRNRREVVRDAGRQDHRRASTADPSARLTENPVSASSPEIRCAATSRTSTSA